MTSSKRCVGRRKVGVVQCPCRSRMLPKRRHSYRFGNRQGNKDIISSGVFARCGQGLPKLHGGAGHGRPPRPNRPLRGSREINWAHIGLAQLIGHGHADRILTTNFDPLIARACALVNVFPAIYDLAASHVFKPDQVSRQAIFHLHGQRDGFVLLNTAAEVQSHRKHLRPVFADAERGRAWIVVGYSGENDPVFDVLARTPRFEYGLYWIGRADSPPNHVADRLLNEGRGAYYIGGWDADDFFVSLARKLNCFPPAFVHRPYSYLKAMLGQISEYKAPGKTVVSMSPRVSAVNYPKLSSAKRALSLRSIIFSRESTTAL